MDLRMIVTGTGRCGTGYMAQVLTRAGVICGHERVFSTAGPRPLIDSRMQADSSWMATPHLSAYPKVPKVLVYREPHLVIGSFLGREFFAHPSDYRSFMFNAEPELASMSDFTAACEHYIRWNRRALDYCGQVHPITEVYWGEIADALSHDLSTLMAAAASVDSAYNNGPRNVVRPEELPDEVWEVHAQLEEAAGYDHHR